MQNGKCDPSSDPISDYIKANFNTIALAGDMFCKQFMNTMFAYFGVFERSYMIHCNKEFRWYMFLLVEESVPYSPIPVK